MRYSFFITFTIVAIRNFTREAIATTENSFIDLIISLKIIAALIIIYITLRISFY
jgi:hypothetical protein